nr:MAG: Protein of unknown function (DUF551) [Bacteriophage sp.]
MYRYGGYHLPTKRILNSVLTVKRLIETTMKREDIKKTATSYANDVCKGSHYRWGLEQYCIVDFMEGAKWRISSVWHDGEKKPKRGAEVLIMLDNNIILKAKFEGWGYSYCTNIEFDNVPEITRWAYVEDLLPNMED